MVMGGCINDTPVTDVKTRHGKEKRLDHGEKKHQTEGDWIYTASRPAMRKSRPDYSKPAETTLLDQGLRGGIRGRRMQPDSLERHVEERFENFL